MPVHFDKAKGRWRYRFRRRVDGVRHQLTKLLPEGWSRAQAEAYDRKEGGRHYAEVSGVQKARLSLAGAIELYLLHRCPELKNGPKAAQDLQLMDEWTASAPLDQVSNVATRYDLEHRATLAPGTIRNRLAYLKAAVRYAYRKHGYGDRDYSDRMMLPAANNERQVYAKLPELDKLWRALKEPEARALFKMVFYMGLRWRAELLTREKSHIRKNGKDVWLQIGITKNGRPVMKPVHPAARAALNYIPFTHADTWFYEQWHAAVDAIGRPDLKPHDLRHSLASEIVSRGGTLEDVRGALHHESLQASRRYAHLYPERVQSVIMGIGGRGTVTLKRSAKK